MTGRQWLRANGYDDIADLIDEVINEWRLAGNGTRRNWWDVLAGSRFNNRQMGKILVNTDRPNKYCSGRASTGPIHDLSSWWLKVPRP